MRKKKNKSDSFKNYIIFFLLSVIIFASVYIFLYSSQVDNFVSDLPYSTNIFFDFEGDEIGSFPGGWNGEQWDGTQVVEWKNSYEPYGHVVEIMDRDGNGAEFAHRFKKAKRGVAEFDILGEKYERISVNIVQLNEEYDATDDIIVHFAHLGEGDETIKIKDGFNKYVDVQDFSKNTWYHVKIEFNLENWDLYIDGDHIYTGFNFNHYEIPPYFCQLYFSTYVDDNVFYVDNVEITVIETI